MIRASILAILLASGAVAAHAAAPAQTTAFKTGASSSGWIEFTTGTNLGIFLPVEIDGHDVMAWLYGGPSTIDKGFAASIGLPLEAGTVAIGIGDLTVQNATVKPGDLPLQSYAKIIGKPVVFMLGQEVFDQLAVEIDFARNRVAFRDPRSVTRPAGAIEVPLIELDGERVVPLSLDGAAPAQFELELGNVIGPLLVSPAYAREHKLLEGHATSQRLSGPFVETVVTLDHLGFAGVDFPRTAIAIIPDSEVPPAAITGGVGLPLLAKFGLLIDYAHNRLYATPDAATATTPIQKDRIGLVLSTRMPGVAFVAPNSPAQAAGFKKGDEIAQIDGKPYDAWPLQDIIKFQIADPGTTHSFIMADGSVRQVKATDFF